MRTREITTGLISSILSEKEICVVVFSERRLKMGSKWSHQTVLTGYVCAYLPNNKAHFQRENGKVIYEPIVGDQCKLKRG